MLDPPNGATHDRLAKTRRHNAAAGVAKLSPTVAMALGNMTAQQRDIFNHEYRKARRNTPVMVLLAVLLPSQWLFLDKTGPGIVFWFSGMFLGVGWIWSWFYTPEWSASTTRT